MSEKILAALDFWERFPYNLACCRSAIMQIQENQDRVFLIKRPQTEVVYVPAAVEVLGLRLESEQSPKLGWILTAKEKISVETFPALFSGCFFSIGGANETTAMSFTPARYRGSYEVWIHETETSDLHKEAEKLLCKELERRGMDPSALTYSGRICRNFCLQMTGAPNPSIPQTWPAVVAGETLSRMHPTDLEAVVSAERSLLRLRTQIALSSEAEPVEEVPTETNLLRGKSREVKEDMVTRYLKSKAKAGERKPKKTDIARHFGCEKSRQTLYNLDVIRNLKDRWFDWTDTKKGREESAAAVFRFYYKEKGDSLLRICKANNFNLLLVEKHVQNNTDGFAKALIALLSNDDDTGIISLLRALGVEK